MEEYTLKGLSKFGEHCTREEFDDAVKSGMFTDYDGIGFYATESQETNIPVYPSDFKMGKRDERFSHIMWYNK